MGAIRGDPRCDRQGVPKGIEANMRHSISVILSSSIAFFLPVIYKSVSSYFGFILACKLLS